MRGRFLALPQTAAMAISNAYKARKSGLKLDMMLVRMHLS